MKPTIGKLTAGIIALMLLVGAFGVYQSVVQAQTATLTVTPVKAAVATTENTWICAKCGDDLAKFDVSVTDASASPNGAIGTVKTTVTNADLGTLGVKTDADSNPKEITLIETGTSTGVFLRTVIAVNKTTGLVSDVIAGTADAAEATLLTDASLTAAVLRDADEGAIVGGTLVYTSGAASGEAKEILGFSIINGTLSTDAFTGVPSAADTYEVYPLVNLADFSGQALSISYTPAGGLGETASITNDEVKATLLLSSPAEDLIVKSGSTITVVFAADITDTSSGFPAKITDLVTNSNTSGNKGTIKLHLGTVVVNLKAENFTAITDGYKVTASFSSSDLENLANKLPWWIEAQDLAGNTQEPSQKISAATSAGTGGGVVASTLTDSAMANGVGVCGTCFVGRKVTLAIDGVNQTKSITGYDPGPGTFTMATGFTIAGTSDGTSTSTTLIDSALIGKTDTTIIGAQLNNASGKAAITAFDSATGQITTGGSILPAGSAGGVAYTIEGIGIDSGTAYTIDKTMLVTIDGTAPILNTVVTGDNWSSTSAAGARLKTGLSAKANSIRVTVTDTSGLDSASVVPSAFSVSGSHTISSVLLVDISGENADPPVARVPNDVFITLGEDLSPSNERPTVTITGGVLQDKAGNSLTGSAPKAVDKLGPKLTVELDNTLSNKEIKSTVTSDELLSGEPTGEVMALTSITTGVLGAVPGSAPGTATTQTGTLTYTKTITLAAVGTGAAGAEFNLYVEGSDTGTNPGKAGHKTDGINASAVTFELDQWLNNGTPPKVLVVDKEAKATNLASNNTTVPKVDGVDPLIVTMEFNNGCVVTINLQDCTPNGESAEYTGDSHKTVTLTSATVKVTFSNSTTETTTYDVATQISSPDNKRFTMPILAPKVGKYLLTIKAQDEAGNIALKSPTATTAQSLTYEWEVIKASPIKVKLSPGWNLISLPFQSSNPAINSVIPADHPITIVMSYDNTTRVWLVSRRDSVTGLFTGDVAVMTADTAYFALTTSFETLDVLRPPLATAGAAPPVPPAIAVFEGWNLVPVLSNVSPPPAGITHTTYFGTLGTNWLSALSWNPLTRTWLTISRTDVSMVAANDRCDTTPGVTPRLPEVCTGEGLWFWVTEDGVLIP